MTHEHIETTSSEGLSMWAWLGIFAGVALMIFFLMYFMRPQCPGGVCQTQQSPQQPQKDLEPKKTPCEGGVCQPGTLGEQVLPDSNTPVC